MTARATEPRQSADAITLGQGEPDSKPHLLPVRPVCRAIRDGPTANLLERNFVAAAPNHIWLADITYDQTDQGWLYLATVMDLYSRKIVGWAMADHLRAELPLAALWMAIAAQRPNAGLIHHSDRGVQGGSKRSSQHPEVEGCDESCKSTFDAVRTSAIAIARPAVCGRTR